MVTLVFKHEEMMKPKPYNVTLDKDYIAVHGLGQDDGAKLIGFGLKGSQTVTVFVDDFKDEPSRAIGLVPSFSDGHGLFEWALEVGDVTP
jgi:hypothetical protein